MTPWSDSPWAGMVARCAKAAGLARASRVRRRVGLWSVDRSRGRRSVVSISGLGGGASQVMESPKGCVSERCQASVAGMEVSLGMVRRAGRPTPLARKAVEKTWKIGVRSGRRDGFFPAMSPGLGSAASAGGELGEDRGQRHRRSARRAPQAATRLQRGELLAYLLELVADRSELGRDGLLEARNQRVPQLLGIIQREVLSRHGGLTRASFRWPSPPLRFRTGGQSAARPALKRRSMWPLSAPSRE